MTRSGRECLAAVAVAGLLGACSPTGLPLSPAERTLPPGSETADAVAAAARGEDHAIYESNYDDPKKPGAEPDADTTAGTTPDAGTDTPPKPPPSESTAPSSDAGQADREDSTATSSRRTEASHSADADSP